MSISAGNSRSKSESESRPTTPEELTAYYNQLNSMSGGRLGSFATEGTAPTHYNALTQEQLQAVGGAGATRQQALDDSYADQTDQINSDSSMTYAQQSQANQQATDAYNQQADAINKEVEASLTGLMSQEQQRMYEAELTNNQQLAKDMALLSEIFYSGKGQHSSSEARSSSRNVSVGFG